MSTYLALGHGRKHVILVPPGEAGAKVAEELGGDGCDDAYGRTQSQRAKFPVRPSPELLSAVIDAGGFWFDLEAASGGVSGRAGGMIGELHWGGDCLGDPGCELEASCELDDTWTMLGWYELAEEPCDVLRPSALGAAAGWVTRIPIYREAEVASPRPSSSDTNSPRVPDQFGFSLRCRHHGVSVSCGRASVCAYPGPSSSTR